MRLLAKGLRLGAVAVCGVLAACSTVSLESFESASPNGAGFTGLLDGSGEPVTVRGILRRPAGPGPFPAVIYIHGSVGPQLYHETVWLSTFRSLGFATYQINAFLPRGVITTVGRQDSVTEASLVNDVFAAAEALARLPDIDPERIGVMGSSKGGIAALVSGKRSFQRARLPGDLTLAFHIALYPYCHTHETYDFDAPVLVMSGGEDRWVGWENCAELVEAMREAGVEASFRLYAGAVHSWDSMLPFRLLVPGADGFAKCRFEVRNDGTFTDLNDGAQLTSAKAIERAARACIRTGAQYAAGDSEVRDASVRDVVAFVRGLGYGQPETERTQPDF